MGTERAAAGMLYVVGTPIGNLDDMSPRARRALAEADLIAAEDTRRTGRLLSSISLKKPLIAYHEHNEPECARELVARALAGSAVALVSDAGMPSISDPGFAVVREARARGIEVRSVPGPSAVDAALSISGLPTDRFVFEGFLPRRSGPRAERLEALAAEPRTLVFFESVHRIAATLADLADRLGPDRPAGIARELTKLHEQYSAGKLAELRERLGDEIPLRGEFVVLVAGAPSAESAEESEIRRVYALLADELPPDRAVALTARVTGAARNAVYKLMRGRREERGR